MSRIYKSGSRWCLWRWKDVVQDGELYLRRLHFIQTPLFSVFIHWILKPDKDRFLHDHPVSFLSIVLRGWYVEEREHWLLMHRVKWFNFVRATDAHRIFQVSQNGVVTLVFSGPPRRTWGFYTDKGWIAWKDFNTKYLR